MIFFTVKKGKKGRKKRAGWRDCALTRLHRRQHRRDAGEFRVKIARVGRARDLRLEGRRHLLVAEVVPVDVAEEGMAHDLLRVGRPRAQAQLGFARQELLQDRDRVARHVDGIQRLVSKDGVVDFVFVFAAEGRLLEKHLVDQNAKRPPVDRSSVFLIEENLSSGFSQNKTSLATKDFCFITSGAMNSGVPQKVLVVEPYHIFSLHSP